MKPTGIKQAATDQAAQWLSVLLADEHVLYVKTRKAHWNVEGLDFYSKHLLFEAQYKQLDELIDDIAERIRTIGHFVPASLKEFLSLTRLSEKSLNINDSKGSLKDLLADHESIIVKIREIVYAGENNVLDAGTVDFITGIMAAHEKMAWMLATSLK